MRAGGSLERTILEDPVATVCLNLDGTVRLWNPAAERLFGFSAAEALGHRPPTVPPSELRKALRLVKRAARGESTQGLEIHRQSSGGLFPSVTMSVGVAAYPDHGQTSEELLGAADRALYRAKAAGRDRVAVADPGDMQGIAIAES